MELKSIKYPFILFLMLATQTVAQYWQRVDSVFAPAGVLAENFSFPFFCDFDKDGDADLFFGSSGNRVQYYENISTATELKYRKDTSVLSGVYANGYQFTNSYYPYLGDLDGDTDLDLIIGGYNGVLYYKNIGSTGRPVWEQDMNVFANVNTLIGTDAKPVLVDIDSDGDLDLYAGIGESLFGGPTAGITIAFRNQGTAQVPDFVQDNSLTSGISDVGLNAYPSFADMDNDGDLDLTMGRDLQTIMYFKNTGSRTVPNWQGSTTLYAAIETTRYWKNPMMIDFDKDGDNDLIYGTDSGLLYYYTNTGTATAATFSYDAEKFKIIKSGNNAATVSLADYDKDGDQDFICGNWLGTFQFYKNDGTKLTPKFKSVATVFTASLDVGSYSTPVFVDIDKDGDQDIASGEMNGSVQLFINNNNTTFTKNTTMFAAVNVTGMSAPTFGDIDGDGDLDLLVGAESSVNIKYYENTGNNIFKQNDTMMTGVSFPSRCAPVFADIDNDYDLDLVIGRSWGTFYLYENIGTAQKPHWVANHSPMNELVVNQNAFAAFADVDGDTKRDAVIGEYDGSFSFFKNLFAPVGNDKVEKPVTYTILSNYPNPFNPSTTISYQVKTSGMTTLKVYSVTGNEIATIYQGYQQEGQHQASFSAQNLSSGVYIVMLQTATQREIHKMILLK